MQDIMNHKCSVQSSTIAYMPPCGSTMTEANTGGVRAYSLLGDWSFDCAARVREHFAALQADCRVPRRRGQEGGL